MKIDYIAIITPLYNEEKNVINFINHLELQTNHNFHLYFINDGSTDSTLNLWWCFKKYADYILTTIEIS